MKLRLKIWTVCLGAVIAVSACIPTVPPTGIPAGSISPEPPESTSTLPPGATAGSIPPTPTQTAEVQPAATSRGPDLEATDPATVSLASGRLQLLEFFRFT